MPIKKQEAREPFYIEVLIAHKRGKAVWISVVNTPLRKRMS
jgi:hypothetical protein